MTAHRSRGPRLFLSDVRFVLSENQSQTISVPKKESHYLRDVLRLQIGDAIEIGDTANGLLGEGEVSELGEQVTVTLRRVAPAPQSSRRSITLLCALCKGEKNDQICDWATELGCQRIVFWQSSRSIVRLRDDRESARKVERLNAIALAAAQQSRQPRPPEVSVHRTLMAALTSLPSLDSTTKLVCSLDPSAARIDSIDVSACTPEPIIIAVGPEGDFSPEEYGMLTTGCGFIPISLGTSVLRSELAVVVALTALQYGCGSVRAIDRSAE
jgi:16S rRNA (uracil1498-N3)-methyltransferase